MSIIVYTKMELPPIFRHIDRFVGKGMRTSSKVVAHTAVNVARENLSVAVNNYGGKESGRLRGAINVMPGGYSETYARTDLYIDVQRAPYWAWVEFGRNAPVGLPYSKTGGRDYSKSKFPGHSYLNNMFKMFKENGDSIVKSVGNIIVGELTGKKSVSALKNL